MARGSIGSFSSSPLWRCSRSACEVWETGCQMLNHAAEAMRRVHARAGWMLPVIAAVILPVAELKSAEGDLQHIASSLLQRYCVECHGTVDPEASVRLDNLAHSANSDANAALTLKVLEAIVSRQMPPAEAEDLPDVDRDQLQTWLTDRLEAQAQDSRRAGRWTRNRRLTAEEYNFSLQSLFGVGANFSDMLLPDPIAQTGFSNDSELLGVSSLHVESYLDSARRAIDRYVQFDSGTSPGLRYHIEFEDLYYFAGDRYGSLKHAPHPLDLSEFHERQNTNAVANPHFAQPLTPRVPGARSEDEALRAAIPKLHQQFVGLPQWLSTGELVLHLRAAGTPDRNGRYPRLRVEAGITLGDGCSVDKRSLGEVDVQASLDNPQLYEFRCHIEDLPSKGPLRPTEAFDRLSVFDMNQIFISNVSCDDQAVFALGRGGYTDAEKANAQTAVPLQHMRDAGVNLLYLDALAVEMLPTHSASANVNWSVPKDIVPEQFLQRFMQAAYRRPVTTAELHSKMDLFRRLQTEGYSGNESLREVMASVLISPAFLYLESRVPAAGESPAEQPTPYQFASRLSYFLWLAPPDAELLQHAADGSLQHEGVWRKEAERLLHDPRSRNFLDSFCRQWLRLDKLANVLVDHGKHPAYDEDLASLSLRETLDYFAEVFVSNASALDLLSSDYAMLNDRLADHYGIDGIIHGDLRRVILPSDSLRGGLLTQASVLTMNSDGVDSHPIRRGVWLLDRLLNAPPLPPPPDVPAIEATAPESRGLTLRQRIELHRQPGSCQSCHQKVDPWGLALENFDATGRWRETVAYNSEHQPSEHQPNQVEPVEASVELPDGSLIDGAQGMQHYLLAHRHQQFTRAVVYHMLTYALGRPLDFADRPQLELLHRQFTESDYRLRELVLAIVESTAFRE